MITVHLIGFKRRKSRLPSMISNYNINALSSCTKYSVHCTSHKPTQHMHVFPVALFHCQNCTYTTHPCAFNAGWPRNSFEEIIAATISLMVVNEQNSHILYVKMIWQYAFTIRALLVLYIERIGPWQDSFG